MLAGIEPHLLGPVADAEIVDRPAVERLAELAVGDARLKRRRGDQRIVAFHRIGREIGEPDQLAVAFPVELQHAVGIARLGHAPASIRSVETRAL